jgi:hypothetical protein
MTSSPAPFLHVIVHTTSEAAAALEAAAETACPVALNSPPNASHWLGSGYFLAMIAAARREVPEAISIAVLDCGTSAGHALAALAAGVEAVRVSAPRPVLAKIRQIATKHRALLFGSFPEDGLDLCNHSHAKTAILNRLVTERPQNS